MAAEEDDGKLGVGVLQGEVNVPGGRGAQVGDFALDPNVGVLGFDDLANVGDEQADGPDAAGGDRSLEGEVELGRGGVANGHVIEFSGDERGQRGQRSRGALSLISRPCSCGKLAAMRVFGIDCGTEVTGYGVVESCETGRDTRLVCLAKGGIQLDRNKPLPVRLEQVFRELCAGSPSGSPMRSPSRKFSIA